MSAVQRLRDGRPKDHVPGTHTIAESILELADRLDKIAPVREPVRDQDGYEVRDDDGWHVTEDGVAMRAGDAVAWIGKDRCLVTPAGTARDTRIPLSVVRRMLAVAP